MASLTALPGFPMPTGSEPKGAAMNDGSHWQRGDVEEILRSDTDLTMTKLRAKGSPNPTIHDAMLEAGRCHGRVRVRLSLQPRRFVLGDVGIALALAFSLLLLGYGSCRQYPTQEIDPLNYSNS